MSERSTPASMLATPVAGVDEASSWRVSLLQILCQRRGQSRYGRLRARRTCGRPKE